MKGNCDLSCNCNCKCNCVAYIGRVILGLAFVALGAIGVFYFQENINVLQMHAVPMPAIALKLILALQMIFGVLIALGRCARSAAVLLIILIIAISPVFLDFWNMTGAIRAATTVQFIVHIALIGGLLLVTSMKKCCVKKDAE